MIHRPLSLRTALSLLVLGALVAGGATASVIWNDYGMRTGLAFAVLALAGFGLTAYGVIQSLLAIVASAGERRRTEGDVTERRSGDRTRERRE